MKRVEVEWRLRPEVLADEIKRTKLSQNAWARRFGVSPAYLSLMVNGKRLYPNQEVRRRMLQALGLDPEQLFEISGSTDRRRTRKLFRVIELRPRLLQIWVPHLNLDLSRTRDRRMRIFVDEIKGVVRSLSRSPGFSVLAILILGLGIGAGAAVFNLVDRLLLSPIPYDSPERMVELEMMFGQPGKDVEPVPWSYPYFQFIEKEAESLDVAGYWETGANLGGISMPTRIGLETVSANYFAVLRINPASGRFFSVDEDRESMAAAVTVLSHALKNRIFGDSKIVGETIRLNGTPFEIIGVAPPGFFGLSNEADLWIPLRRAADVSFPARLSPSRTLSMWIQAVGRLRPEVEIERSRQEINGLAMAMKEAFPLPEWASDSRIASKMIPLAEAMTPDQLRQPLWTLFTAVILVLLVACANVAGMLLARGLSRRKDIEIRLALGARWGQVLRLLLWEALVLAATGGLFGLVLCAILTSLVTRLQSPGLDFLSFSAFSLSLNVLLFTSFLAFLSGILCGSLPWLSLKRLKTLETLRGHRGPAPRRQDVVNLLRPLLVSFEFALALVLVIAAGLMLQSFQRLSEEHLGFEAENVVAARIALPRNEYAGREALFFSTVVDRIASLTGVSGSAVADCVPLFGRCDLSTLSGPTIESEEAAVVVNKVSQDFFRTLSIPLLAGRTFESQDGPGSQRVVLINKATAERWWPDQNPVGQQVRAGIGWGDDLAKIIGVVDNVRYEGAMADTPPMLYTLSSQFSYGDMVLIVQSEARPDSLLAQVRSEVAALDNDLPVFSAASLDRKVADAYAFPRLLGSLLLAFAILTLILSAAGVYGLLACHVSERLSEVGIRLALGARRSWVVGRVFRDAFGMAAGGWLAGLLVIAALTRFLENQLYETDVFDPYILLIGSLLLLFSASLASLIPAVQAARINPAETLKG